MNRPAGWPRCSSCGELVSPRDPGLMREVTGWSQQRSAGGQNHVWFRAETGRVMCGGCAYRSRIKGSADQAQLF